MADPNGIVSWVTENNYSKTTELLYFILSICIPAVFCFCFGLFFNKSKIDKNTGYKYQKNFFSFYLIPTLLYFILLRLNINWQIDLYHEGEKLQLTGIPYKDFYLQHGLILNYGLPKLGTLLFSDSIEGIRKIFCLIEPCAYLILYYLGLNVFRGGAITAILPPIFCNGAQYWIGHREGLAIAVILTLISTENFFLTGLVSGLAFWFSLDYGIYAISACLGYLVLCNLFISKNFEDLSKYLSGLALSSLPIFVLFIILGNFADFLSNTYAQLRFQSTVWGLPFKAFEYDIWSESFRIYASILVLIITSSFLAFKAGAKQIGNYKNLLLVTLLAIFFFRTALGRSDYGHWIDGSTLIYILIFIPFDHYIFGKHNLKIKAIAITSLIPILYFLNEIHQPINEITQVFNNYWPDPEQNVSLAKIGKIKIPEAQRNKIIKIKNFIDTNSERNDYIYDFSNQSAYYYLLDRKSPTKFHNVIYAATKNMQLELINELEFNKPKIVIFNTGTIFDNIDNIPTNKRSSYVFDYINKNYKTTAEIEGAILMTAK